jgi:hypothetical protein
MRMKGCDALTTLESARDGREHLRVAVIDTSAVCRGDQTDAS